MCQTRSTHWRHFSFDNELMSRQSLHIVLAKICMIHVYTSIGGTGRSGGMNCSLSDNMACKFAILISVMTSLRSQDQDWRSNHDERIAR